MTPRRGSGYLRGLWLSGLRLGEAVALSWDQDAPFHADLTGRAAGLPNLRAKHRRAGGMRSCR